MTTRLEGQPHVQVERAVTASQANAELRSGESLGIASTNDAISTSESVESPNCLILIFRALMSCIESLIDCFFSIFEGEREALPPEKVPQDPQQLREFQALWLDSASSFNGKAFIDDFNSLRDHVRENLMQAVKKGEPQLVTAKIAELRETIIRNSEGDITDEVRFREAVYSLLKTNPPTPSFIRQFEIELREAEAVEAAQMLALNSES